jgi:PEGA domain
MIPTKSFQLLSSVTLGLAFLLCAPDFTQAQQNQVMGELKFSGATKVARDSGVWIDGQYVGYLKELKGDKKIMLLPGQHEISVRQAGYNSFTQTVVVEPGRVHTLSLQMTPDGRPLRLGPDAAELKLTVNPNRAAVFVDDGYVGHAAEFGGAFHSMLLSPGKHRIKVELPGYRTFETEVNLLPRQKSKVETDLVVGSILQAGPLIKEQ